MLIFDCENEVWWEVIRLFLLTLWVANAIAFVRTVKMNEIMNTVMYCTRCGGAVTDTMKYCPQCGSFIARPCAGTPSVIPPPYRRVPVQPVAEKPVGESRRNPLGLAGFIVAMAVFVLMVLTKDMDFMDKVMREASFGIMSVIGFVLSCCGLGNRPVGFAVAGLVINAVWLTFMLLIIAG